MKKDIKQLADLIEQNPKCKFVIDNDCWWIEKQSDVNSTEPIEIASSSEYDSDESGWYSGAEIYGGGLASALIVLLNRRGFEITATAC